MRIPTLAACAVAAVAAQSLNQQAIAAVDASTLPPESEPTDTASRSNEEVVVEPTQAIAAPETFEAESSETALTMVAPETAVIPETAIPTEAIVLPETTVAEPSDDSLTWVAQIPSPRWNEAERAIEIPVEMPVVGQNPGLTAQTRPSGALASPTRVSIEGQELPVPGVLPISFKFPIRTQIVSNPSISTNTPITDQEFPNPLPRANVGSLEELARYREARTVAINIWAEQIRGCLVEYPNLVSLRVVRGPNGGSLEEQIPVLFNGNRGRIVKNGNGRLVCPP